MATFFWTLLARILLLFVSLRYRIEVKGLENLARDKLHKRGGILFLPNHPALMDPFFLYLLLWPRFRMRPLVIEYIYRTPFLRRWMKLVRAIAMPNFETAVNQLKIRRAEEAMHQIANGLKRKENFVFYPSGKLKSSGKEILGGASGAQALLHECPDANVVLIRTTGLWGSKFSRAIEGRSPKIVKLLFYGIQTLLKNALFFAPRRKVLIEIESNPPDLPIESRLEVNRYLEIWYNQYPDGHTIAESEPLKLVSYSWWKRDVPHVNQKKQRSREAHVEIDPTIREKINQEIRRLIQRPEQQIEDEMQLATDLGMDSLNIAELIGFIAHHFDVPDLHPEEIQVVRDVWEIAQGAHHRAPMEESGTKFHWTQDHRKRPPPTLPLGATIPEAFLNICQRMKGTIACGDDLVGPLSFEKLKLSILVLAQAFRRLPGKHIGVLLPASVGAYITILALQMAKKVPVMLNWTLGARYLDEMLKLSGAETVISSWRFLDRLSHVDFGSCIDKFRLLEDIRKQLSLTDKLKGAVLAHSPTGFVLHSLKIHQLDPQTPAVILFTSGTEATPKGVPLSHSNILSNQRSGMQCIDLNRQDVLYGVLPPFHSFGFSVAGLFPLLAGIKVAFYPDPTDSFALAEGIHRWKITMFCAAPSFLKGLFHAAHLEQLKTVRYFVSGAEKASDELYAAVTDLGTGAHLLEGYGITECSPILSINSPNIPPKGVGRLLPDVEMITIHLETQERLPDGAEGEICVRGPNVFQGYLGHPRNPFIEIRGKKWYRTGDIGYLDENGYLILSGRLKRFAKFGGEMISLGAIEETLLKAVESKKEGPILAVCSKEEGGHTQIFVFATTDLDTQRANQILQEAGFSRLVKITEVKHIEEIPLMGSGKIDYRTLQSKL